MTPTPLTLVVLAAGMGSRFGGPKQLDGVGPGGATLMDYSVFDARRAGFTDVVFVIRPDMEDAFRPLAAERFGDRLRVGTALQRLHDPAGGARVPPGRVKPWGTAHAVLSAAAAVTGPFAVVNADDFYGEAAFRAAAGFLEGRQGTGVGDDVVWGVVGYPLGETMSAAGGVNRAVCHTLEGWLTGVEEVSDIVADGQGLSGRGSRGAVRLAADTLVSMNMWAFDQAVFASLRRSFASFLATPGAESAEFVLPAAVEQAIRDGTARVKVLPPGSRWFGLTHRADRPAVAEALGELVQAGRYPERLW